MLQDKIECHHPALDCEYLMLPTIAVVRLADELVQLFGSEVINDAIGTVLRCAQVAISQSPSKEVLIQLAATLADVHKKLPPNEVPAVEGGRHQKRCLALRVTGRDETADTFFVCHRFQIEIRPAMISGSSSAALLGALSGA